MVANRSSQKFRRLLTSPIRAQLSRPKAGYASAQVGRLSETWEVLLSKFILLPSKAVLLSSKAVFLPSKAVVLPSKAKTQVPEQRAGSMMCFRSEGIIASAQANCK